MGPRLPPCVTAGSLVEGRLLHKGDFDDGQRPTIRPFEPYQQTRHLNWEEPDGFIGEV